MLGQTINYKLRFMSSKVTKRAKVPKLKRKI